MMGSRDIMSSKRRRASSRGVTAVEAAVTFAVVGSLLAVAVPAFLRELHASRFVEPASGVEKMAELAVAYAHERPIATAFPPSAPLTPSQVPRGTREVDPPGAWDQPTWKALGFRPFAEGVPHAYAFGFDSVLGARVDVAQPAAPLAPSSLGTAAVGAQATQAGGLPGAQPATVITQQARSTFTAHAHGDLDGDGITSTFEMRGHAAEGEPAAVIEPGMLVEAEVE
jgi:hypothetical protein